MIKIKSELRLAILNTRKQIQNNDIQNQTDCIILRLWTLIHTLNIKDILVYFPLAGEVNLIPLYKALWKNHYRLYFPTTNPIHHTMEFYLCSCLEDLKNTDYLPSLKEPVKQKKSLISQQQAIAIIPSLALDHQGVRLGFGQGYYDRYLNNNPNILKIAPNFDSLLFKTIPSEKWDIFMDIIITEKKTLDLRK